MPDDTSPPPSRPKMVYHCPECGKWKSGPLRGRYDVPFEEIAALAEEINGHPLQAPHVTEPAQRRTGGTVYKGTMDGLLSHGPCMKCAQAGAREQGARAEAYLAALEGAPEYPAKFAYEREAQPGEPTEEEARRFLSGQGDEEGGEG